MACTVSRSRATKCRFKERLRCQRFRIEGVSILESATVSSGQTRSAAAVLPNHLAVGLGERLSSQGHHVRHRVDIDGLEIVVIASADIAEFDGRLAIDLPLHCQIELMAQAGPEVRV